MDAISNSWWGAAAGAACAFGTAHFVAIAGAGGPAGLTAVVAACFIKVLASMDD